jgi:hypothetical protein
MNEIIVTDNKYFDHITHNALWSEPMTLQRLWKVGDTFVRDYVHYDVKNVSVEYGIQNVYVENKSGGINP